MAQRICVSFVFCWIFKIAFCWKLLHNSSGLLFRKWLSNFFFLIRMFPNFSGIYISSYLIYRLLTRLSCLSFFVYSWVSVSLLSPCRKLICVNYLKEYYFVCIQHIFIVIIHVGFNSLEFSRHGAYEFQTLKFLKNTCFSNSKSNHNVQNLQMRPYALITSVHCILYFKSKCFFLKSLH